MYKHTIPMDKINQQALDLHKKHQGKLATTSLVEVTTRDDLSFLDLLKR